MKYLLSTVMLLLWVKGFSQFGDSLVIRYSIGYDCHYEVESRNLRGACGNMEEISYKKQRRAYTIKSFVSKSSFREWKGRQEIIEDSVTHEKRGNWIGGFGPNLVTDSVKQPVVLNRRKLPAKSLNDFLEELVSIHSDTVFPYSVETISSVFLRKIGGQEDLRDSLEIDSLIHDSFSVLGMSTVTGYLTITFRFHGKQAYLSKDTNNPYWSLSFSGDAESEPIKVIYFAFDAFIKEKLPQKFSGRGVLNE